MYFEVKLKSIKITRSEISQDLARISIEDLNESLKLLIKCKQGKISVHFLISV